MAQTALVAATDDDELIRVLGNSLYPGARPESIRLVLAWCRATNRDPMKKPIHIVPMNVKDATTGKYAWRDVLMPGIGTYRSDAANSGTYAGKDEPEFGPEITRKIDQSEVTYPQWCKVTVYKIVASERRAFTVKEFWMENYASGQGGNGVNAMWSKRPYGQLAKVAEAQALRAAFPDETGNTNTSEELEGKTVFEGQTIDAEPERKELRETRREQHRPIKTETYEAKPDEEGDEAERISAFMVQTDAALRNAPNGSEAHKTLIQAYAAAPTLDDLAALEGHPFRRVVRETYPSYLREAADRASVDAANRLGPKAKPWKDPTWDAPANGNGHDLAGNGGNGTHAQASTAESEGEAVREEVEKLAGNLAADKDESESAEDDGWPGPS
jgi:phage recombination protein Bet